MAASSNAMVSSRRAFLKTSVLTAVGLNAVNSLLLGGCSDRYRLMIGDFSPRFFTIKEFAVLMALTEVLLPEREGFPSAGQARLAERIDLEMTYHPQEAVAGDMRAALTVVEYGAFLSGRFHRFTAMSPKQRTAFLERAFAGSNDLLRRAVGGIKMVAMLLYYSDDRTWAKIGYRGPYVERKLPEASNALERLG